MRSLLALVSRDGQLDPGLMELVAAVAPQTLPFRSMPWREEAWRSPDGRVALFCWDNDLEPAPPLPLVIEIGGRAVTGAGYVVHPSISDPWNVALAGEEAPLDDHNVSMLGGVFVLLQTGDGGRLDAWRSTSRASPLYWTEGPEYYAIGTRALLLASLANGGGSPGYDPESLVPFLACGRFVNEQMPFRGVHVVPVNSCLVASASGVSTKPVDTFEDTCGTVTPTGRDYDLLAELLVTSVQPLRGRRVICNLTGGKDSRMAAATLSAAGVEFESQTSGFPDSPDVIVGGKVADALGVPHRNTARAEVRSDAPSVLSVDPLDRTRRVLFGADGMLTGYENLAPPDRFSAWPISVGGQGGELALRDTFAQGIVTWDQALHFLHDQYLYHARLLSRPSAEGYSRFLRDWIEAVRARGVSPYSALELFDCRFDSGVSGAGRTVTEIGRYGLYPFLDNQVLKAGMQTVPRVKVSETLLFNLLNRLAPHLTGIPFANQRWVFESRAPRRGDEAGWARRAPLTAPAGTRGSFNWRYRWSIDLWDIFYEQIFGDARAASLFDIVDRDAARSWFQRHRGVDDREGAAFAWACYSAAVLLSGAWLQQDTTGQVIEIRVPAMA